MNNIFERVLQTLGIVDKKLKNDESNALENQKLTLLYELYSYIIDSSYVKNAETREKLQAFFNTYKKYSSPSMTMKNRLILTLEILEDGSFMSAELKDLNLKTIQGRWCCFEQESNNEARLYRIRTNLNSLITYWLSIVNRDMGTVINLIIAGEVDQAREQFESRRVQKDVFECLPKGVIELMPSPKESSEIEPKECIEALNYFRFLKTDVIKCSIEHYGVDKVAHLNYILETDDAKFIDIKRVFTEYLYGRIGADELLERL